MKRHVVTRTLAVVALAVGLMVVLAGPAHPAAGTLTTVAGGPGVGTATSIAVNPRGLAVSGTTLYVADLAGDVLRKINLATGATSVLAGNGVAGFAGDGELGTSAQLNDPADVEVDGSGNVYVADSLNHRIRKANAVTGVVTTVAGSNSTGGYTGDGGAATAARLNAPTGVALDTAGNLYISDTANNVIRKVTAATGVISTMTSPVLNSPRGIAVNAAGDVFVAEFGANRIMKLVAAGGSTRIAGSATGSVGNTGDGGLATSALLSGPTGVALDTSDNLYVGDTANNRVRKVTAGTGNISAFAGTGTVGLTGNGAAATAAKITAPTDVTVDGSGNVFIAQFLSIAGNGWRSPFESAVRKVDGSLVISTVAGNGWASTSGDGGPRSSAQLDRPSGMAIDSAGNLFVSEAANHRVRRIAPDGTITTVAGVGTSCAPPPAACNNAITGDGGLATAAYLASPMGLAVNAAGDLFICDYNHHRIRKVDRATGIITTVVGVGSTGLPLGDGGQATAAKISSPRGVDVMADGTLYLTDANERIRKVAPGGVISTIAGTGVGAYSGDGGPATAAGIASPYAVKVGPDGRIYIAELGSHRIRVVNGAGIINTFAGTGTSGYSGDGGSAVAARIANPWGIAFDPWGNLYIADHSNRVVRRVDRTGVISTVAGTPGGGLSGDGRLVQPVGLAFTAAGDLYISDYLAQRVHVMAKSASTAVWWASDTTSAHSGARYSWQFQTSTMTAVSKVTMTVPSGTGAPAPVVAEVFGLPSGGTVALTGTTLTYTLPTATTLDSAVRAYLTVDGITNTASTVAFVSTVTTLDALDGVIDVAATGVLSFAPAPAPAVRPVPIRSTTFDVPPGSQEIMLTPGIPGSSDTTLTVATTAPVGYTLAVQSTSLTGGQATFAAVSSGVASAVAPGAFPDNRFGYAVSVGGSGTGVRQGLLAGDRYAGYTASGEHAVVAPTAATGDLITLTNRAQVDFTQPPGLYTAIVTYTLVPVFE
jgi:sugar lactone lactonase YvrE